MHRDSGEEMLESRYFDHRCQSVSGRALCQGSPDIYVLDQTTVGSAFSAIAAGERWIDPDKQCSISKFSPDDLRRPCFVARRTRPVLRT